MNSSKSLISEDTGRSDKVEEYGIGKREPGILPLHIGPTIISNDTKYARIV
ncbi:MAG: hypothetical protein HeimC3_38650 [Candidatus Heimdallarchaeota archaeon LC_3]|nr:MAG: hypothetical protein HeimC3_38650 [Candidatus Heimdallarchaeota archaeon LC_3]